MLVALMVFLIGVPVAIDLDMLPIPTIRALGITAILAIGIWSLKGSGRLFHIAMAFAAIGAVLNLTDVVRPGATVYLMSNLATLAFLGLATAECFRQIATTNTIDANRITGAICVYFLLGVMWSVLYAVLEYVVPGSFAGLTAQDTSDWNPDWIYYSFVTLTTLGYGDILPISFSARALAYMEAVVGQFYIAILVAGLVSAYMSEKQSGG